MTENLEGIASATAVHSVASARRPSSSPSTITLTVWQSETGNRPLHDARSPYVERCWLPILGPSTLLFLRFAVRALEREPSGAELDVVELARSLGLGGRTGDHAPFRRMLARATDFRIARVDDHNAVAVRRHLPELSKRQLEKAPVLVRDAHGALRRGVTPPDPTSEHALRLARALVALGEAPDEIESQLRRWRFSPAVASLSATTATSITPSDDPADQTVPHPVVNRFPRPLVGVVAVRDSR
jgi:hypothetical protein